MGVDVFFVISGFLISGIILRQLHQGSFDFVDFYARRIRRIFPALITLLLSTAAVAWVVIQPQHYRRFGSDVVAGAFFAENLWFYFTLDGRTQTAEYLLAHLWTLGVEEQFYFTWPLLLWAGSRLLRRQFLPIALVLSASLLSYGLALWRSPIVGFLLPWNRLWELALGGALAYAQSCGAGAPVRRVVRNLAGTLGMVMLIAAYAGMLRAEQGLGWQPLLPSFGTALLIWAGRGYWLNRYVLSARPVVFIGILSYPLYLFHLPLFVFAAMLEGRGEMAEYAYVKMQPTSKVIVVAISFALALFTYRFIETPARSRRRAKPIAGALFVLMTASAVIVYWVYR